MQFVSFPVQPLEWISYFIPHFAGYVITYPCWNLIWPVKGTQKKKLHFPEIHFFHIFIKISLKFACNKYHFFSSLVLWYSDTVNKIFYLKFVDQKPGLVAHETHLCDKQMKTYFSREFKFYKCMNTAMIPNNKKQGKSEGFESCDRPIVRKRPIWVKIVDVLSRVTLKFDGWPWKTIGHLSYAVSSFVQHFIAIGEFKLELLSRNAQFGSIRRFLEPWDLEIWRMTLKNNRAPLLCYFKLYASFRSHRWIQAGITVRKRPIWVKMDDFYSRVTLQFDVWPWKTIGHLFCATSSFVHHFVAIGDFKPELQSGNTQFGSNATIFRAVWPWNLMDDLEKQ